MSSAAQAKGDRFTRDAKRYLRDQGVSVHTLAKTGENDEADLLIAHGIIEAKALRKYDIGGMMKEAEIEAFNAGMTFAWGLQKNYQKPIGESYLVLKLKQAPLLFRILENVQKEHIEAFLDKQKERT